MLIANILFYVFSSILVLSALMVVSVRNPVYSVLFLIFAFFNSAALFILLGAEFIAMLIVIVYVGAVAVLFLFVVMMLNVNFQELRVGFVKYLPIGLLVAAVMLLELVLIVNYSIADKAGVAPSLSPVLEGVSNTTALGMLIYTKYIYPFQLAGVILLVAMIGAIVLTNRTRDGVRKQSIAKQIERNRQTSVEIVKVQSGKGV